MGNKVNHRNFYASLSARRAWIEIVYPGTWTGSILSLSARRAWIEMMKKGQVYYIRNVALRKESVDRNCISVNILSTPSSRSPQGERG